MIQKDLHNFIQEILHHTPNDWIYLTTHRLDIYNEELAKTEFLTELEKLYTHGKLSSDALESLPTAYDYIRLGHPLSSVLEWSIAKHSKLSPEQIISFDSQSMPLMAVLRSNALANKNTLVCYRDALPRGFDPVLAKSVYGYSFELLKLEEAQAIPQFNGSTVYISEQSSIYTWNQDADFAINLYGDWGAIISVNKNSSYVSDIQHVRRRESIAMTPQHCFEALAKSVAKEHPTATFDTPKNRKTVLDSISKITKAHSPALLASSGLSIQYAIMMGLVHHAKESYPGKEIKIIVPPNCYGGTNDQARRVAKAVANVEVLDLPVDGKHDMVKSTQMVLDYTAKTDAVPLIIAEIPTNPRVEVPDLSALREALAKARTTPGGEEAIAPVFILDQTFCPNVLFLSKNGFFKGIQAISYVSGSKFPSGGKCTAGYCVANEEASPLMSKIEQHLILCDNEATDLQISLLAEQMPSMNERIAAAYKNTREFVSFIEHILPNAKINFVSEELANQGFTPSVFSLDLPTKGDNPVEREAYKRQMNHKLITAMITQIPHESKYCVSYGQLKGCYWTIPATSTQGTTKESDKDYIARVSVSGNLDLEKHKEVFKAFAAEL